VVFASGSTFTLSAGSNPFAVGQPNSKVVFNTGSLFIQTSGTPAFSGRTYADFQLNTGSAQTVTGTVAVSINNLTVTGNSTLNFNMTGTPGHAIKGNITVNPGSTLNFIPASAGTINLNGSTAQTISSTNAITISANSTINITNSNGVVASPAINVAGTIQTGGYFTLAPGGSLVVTGSIIGTVTLQQNFIGQRGWRVLANPFTTAQTLSTVAANNGILIRTSSQNASGTSDVRTYDNTSDAG